MGSRVSTLRSPTPRRVEQAVLRRHGAHAAFDTISEVMTAMEALGWGPYQADHEERAASSRSTGILMMPSSRRTAMHFSSTSSRASHKSTGCGRRSCPSPSRPRRVRLPRTREPARRGTNVCAIRAARSASRRRRGTSSPVFWKRPALCALTNPRSTPTSAERE